MMRAQFHRGQEAIQDGGDRERDTDFGRGGADAFKAVARRASRSSSDFHARTPAHQT
jgi:hypothetical protein